MKRQKLTNYFAKNHRDHKLFVASVFAFLFLAFETIFSGTTANLNQGHIVFSVDLSFVKLISIAIYLCTAILIAVAVPYKLLLIPDFFLLILKLHTVFSEVSNLQHTENLLLTLSNIEYAVESLLFSVFLLSLILGKLLKKPKTLVKNSPFVCLTVLAVCFPFTLGFEIVKLIMALSAYHRDTFISVFNFLRGIINETVLDLPYAMLILLIYFVPEKTFMAFKNHLKYHENIPSDKH